jgi:predicted O-linked N-acetylglucosamine transferase (SPINDLY family)
MSTDLFTSALIQSMARNFSVAELVRTVETLRTSGQAGSATALYSTWIEHNGDNPLLYAVLFNYAVTLTDAGQLESARTVLERAVGLNPDFMPLHINLGRVYERLGAVGLAVMQWSTALSKMTAITGSAIGYKTTALNQSARALEGAGQDEAAEKMLNESLEIDPRQREVVQHLVALRQRQCEWPVVAPSERAGRDTLMEAMSPLSLAAYTDDPMLQLASACNYNRLDVGTPAAAMTAWPVAEGARGPLRVGYLCSDLREHALGYLLTEVLELHRRESVEVFAYYCGPKTKDALHARFQAGSDHWIPISDLSDEAAAARIAADGIQILVDLNGYTREARLKLVACRPAPVIVNWLGFPGTMASPYHHYIVADDWIVPESHEQFYSEKVLRLPCYQPSARQRALSPRRPSRAEAGLPENAMVYCCFNGTHKINRFTFDRWLMILAATPGSVLWLLAGPATTNDRLRAHAVERGVAPERLVFAERASNPEHLARYPLADLFLDTTPYGAHTTASDALWMGVPVLTLSGRSFASRVCGSLVRSAGTPELVCTSPREYVERAIELGRDPSALVPLRERLQEGRDHSTLFDMPGLVRSLEDLYARMWKEFEAGELPRPDLANLNVYLEAARGINHDELEIQSIGDYDAWWHALLEKYDCFRPISPDRRMWNAARARSTAAS